MSGKYRCMRCGHVASVWVRLAYEIGVTHRWHVCQDCAYAIRRWLEVDALVEKS